LVEVPLYKPESRRFDCARSKGKNTHTAERGGAERPAACDLIRGNNLFCGRSRAGVACSNPAEGLDICVVCCTLKAKEQAGTIKRKKKYGKVQKENNKRNSRKQQKFLTWSLKFFIDLILPAAL
jgi:hypothetical protein